MLAPGTRANWVELLSLTLLFLWERGFSGSRLCPFYATIIALGSGKDNRAGWCFRCTSPFSPLVNLLNGLAGKTLLQPELHAMAPARPVAAPWARAGRTVHMCVGVHMGGVCACV